MVLNIEFFNVSCLGHVITRLNARQRDINWDRDALKPGWDYTAQQRARSITACMMGLSQEQRTALQWGCSFEYPMEINGDRIPVQIAVLFSGALMELTAMTAYGSDTVPTPEKSRDISDHEDRTYPLAMETIAGLFGPAPGEDRLRNTFGSTVWVRNDGPVWTPDVDTGPHMIDPPMGPCLNIPADPSPDPEADILKARENSCQTVPDVSIEYSLHRYEADMAESRARNKDAAVLGLYAYTHGTTSLAPWSSLCCSRETMLQDGAEAGARIWNCTDSRGRSRTRAQAWAVQECAFGKTGFDHGGNKYACKEVWTGVSWVIPPTDTRRGQEAQNQ